MIVQFNVKKNNDKLFAFEKIILNEVQWRFSVYLYGTVMNKTVSRHS